MRNSAEFDNTTQISIKKRATENAVEMKDFPSVFFDPIITDGSKKTCTARGDVEP